MVVISKNVIDDDFQKIIWYQYSSYKKILKFRNKMKSKIEKKIHRYLIDKLILIVEKDQFEITTLNIRY